MKGSFYDRSLDKGGSTGDSHRSVSVSIDTKQRKEGGISHSKSDFTVGKRLVITEPGEKQEEGPDEIVVTPNAQGSTTDAIRYIRESIRTNMPPHIFKSMQQEIQSTNRFLPAYVSELHLGTLREEIPVVEPPRSHR